MNKTTKQLIHFMLVLVFSLPFSHVACASPEDITMDVIDANSDDVSDVMHELEIPEMDEHSGEREVEDNKSEKDSKDDLEESESAKEDSDDSKDDSEDAKEDAEDSKEDAENAKDEADEVEPPEPPEN